QRQEPNIGSTVRQAVAYPTDHFGATTARQVYVEQHDIRSHRADRRHRLVDVAGLTDDLNLGTELGPYTGAAQSMVVHQDDSYGRRHRAIHGSESSTSVPPPGEVRICTVPPARCIRSRIESRRPRRSSGTVSGSKPLPRSRIQIDTCSGSL